MQHQLRLITDKLRSYVAVNRRQEEHYDVLYQDEV